jgi:hypothetical protein
MLSDLHNETPPGAASSVVGHALALFVGARG